MGKSYHLVVSIHFDVRAKIFITKSSLFHLRLTATANLFSSRIWVGGPIGTFSHKNLCTQSTCCVQLLWTDTTLQDDWFLCWPHYHLRSTHSRIGWCTKNKRTVTFINSANALFVWWPVWRSSNKSVSAKIYINVRVNPEVTGCFIWQ